MSQTVWFLGAQCFSKNHGHIEAVVVMMVVMWMMKCQLHCWRKPKHPEVTTGLRQVTDKCPHIRPVPSPGIVLGPQWCEVMVFSQRQHNDNTTTNVEPVHSYDAFHTVVVGPGVKGIIGMHRFNFCRCRCVVVVLSL